MNIFNKRKHTQTYTMDVNTANETLQNVFLACNQPPNTVPFDKLLLRRKLNTRHYTICICIILLFLVLTFLSPFVFMHHSVSKIVTVNGYHSSIIVVDHYLKKDYFCLVLSGKGIDYADAYLTDSSGQKMSPSSFDVLKGHIVFPYDGKEVQIYIPSDDGTTLHLLLSPQDLP